jgi:predicted lipoprotein with Yx(FWY)xxD motif
MSRFLTAAAAVAALAIACCGDDDSSGAASGGAATATETTAADEPAPATSPQPVAVGTTVKVADSDYGSILFDDTDQAIYLFGKESSAKSECYGECADAWPPVLTEGAPQAGAGADPALLGTTERDDGSTQVTYNGHPLYYYVDDPKGEVLCHDVSEFGGLWLVVKPNGEAAA